MSSASGAGAPPPAGVVCNSALTFVAAAQPLQAADNVTQENLEELSGGEMAQEDRIMPPGLKSLCDACSKLYPDQPNPLQVTTRLKYWLGGEDPLDYISMYWNPGKPEENIPPHWHYISFGLSDLHGDGRVHPAGAGPDSGYGFELTLRVRGSAAGAPLWPAALLQALARYVFTTGNKFCAGDHISWHRSLDGAAGARVRHLLVAREPALQPAATQHGAVAFLQIVGCTSRELRAAQRGSGLEVLRLMREDPNCGGSYLVTSPRRRASARGVRAGGGAGAGGGAALAGVSCGVRWAPGLTTQKAAEQPSSGDSERPPPSPAGLPAGLQQQIKETLQRGLSAMSTDSQGKGQAVGHMSTDSFEMSSIERALPQLGDTASSWASEAPVRYLDSVHVLLNAEGASLLPLAIDGRIKQGAHFTWREGGCAVTMLPPCVSGAVATLQRPFAARGGWLQVVITKQLSDELSALVSDWAGLWQSGSESEGEDAAPPALPLAVTAGGLTLTVA